MLTSAWPKCDPVGPMTAEIKVRGYAAPFNEWAWIPDERVWERFAPKAFDLSLNVDLRVQHHGRPFASLSRKSLSLFQDESGLGFEAALTPDCDVWGFIPSMRASDIGASVNLRFDKDYDCREVLDADGVTHRTINRVKIDHIALEGSPAYAGTPVWLSVWDPDDMRPNLRAAARRWAAGKDAAGVLLPAASTEPRPAAAITAPIIARATKRAPVQTAIMRRLDALLREHRQCNMALLPPRPKTAK